MILTLLSEEISLHSEGIVDFLEAIEHYIVLHESFKINNFLTRYYSANIFLLASFKIIHENHPVSPEYIEFWYSKFKKILSKLNGFIWKSHRSDLIF